MPSLTPDKITPQLTNTIANLPVQSIGADVIEGTESVIQTVTQTYNSIISQITNVIGSSDAGLLSFLESEGIEIGDSWMSRINAILGDFTFPSQVYYDNLIAWLTLTPPNYDYVANYIRYFSSLNDAEIMGILRGTIKTGSGGLGTTLSKLFGGDTSNTVFSKVNKTKESAEFSYINSYEELLSELAAIKREITTIILHWSDTESNKHLTANDIDDMQRAMGAEKIGYHYVIRRDGTLQRGRSPEEQGDHTHRGNARTLAVVMVGGYNCPTGTVNPAQYQGADSLTPAQYTTLEILLEVYYTYYPGGQVLGHNDLEDVPDPGFDVRSFCKSRFNRTSVYAGRVTNILSVEEINNSI